MNFNTLGRTWIVAEIGVNHEGDPEMAADLIRMAAAAGADAVKFQTYSAENYISTVQPERLDRAGRFQISRQDFRNLADVASDAGIVFFSTPLHPSDADFLDEICPVFKISSGDLTYLDLISHVAGKNRPMIISTGLGTREEIQAAIDAVLKSGRSIVEAGNLVLMHCVAAYPTPAEEANLSNIKWLRDTFDLPTGYSDHTLGIKACELAVAGGALIVEKHFTYRKENQEFHDHVLSADPQDLRDLVSAVRQAEVFLGSAVRRRTPSEEKLLIHLRRSIGAACRIPAGVPVRREWLTCLRPAWGLPPKEMDNLVGCRLTRDIETGGLITENDIAS